MELSWKVTIWLHRVGGEPGSKLRGQFLGGSASPLSFKLPTWFILLQLEKKKRNFTQCHQGHQPGPPRRSGPPHDFSLASGHGGWQIKVRFCKVRRPQMQNCPILWTIYLYRIPNIVLIFVIGGWIGCGWDTEPFKDCSWCCVLFEIYKYVILLCSFELTLEEKDEWGRV